MYVFCWKICHYFSVTQRNTTVINHIFFPYFIVYLSAGMFVGFTGSLNKYRDDCVSFLTTVNNNSTPN